MTQSPLILAIDDNEAEVRPKVPDGFELSVIDPNVSSEAFSKAISEQIEDAALILLDQRFRDEPISISLNAQDGSSFVSHLRSWARHNKSNLAPIVMFTNEAEAFANEVPAVGAAVPIGGTFVDREHRLAPTLDVEWIQFKEADNATDRIKSLANAFLEVRGIAGDDGISLDEIGTLLRIPKDVVWEEQAREELQNSRPPVNQKSDKADEPTRGPSQVIRWLCQRALPYPGLFLSDHHAAWALGISLDVFDVIALVEPGTEWMRELQRARYKGPLHDFFGRRWWRSGIDQLVWLLDEKTGEVGTRREAYKALAPNHDLGDLQPPSSNVVLCDEDFIETEIGPIADAIQLHPPGWPAEALEPWMIRDEVDRDPVLRAMADPTDLS